MKEIEILVVEDSPSDAKLMLKVLEVAKLHNQVRLIRDGEAALRFLRRQPPYETAMRPDLILLDLNLPKRSGFEVLEVIKQDEDLRVIPVVVMTTSDDEADILASYKKYANSYVKKPVDFEQFQNVIQTIDNFWFSIVKLPPRENV